MKLVYKILWIEDQMHSIRAKKRVLTNYVNNDKGFELEIKEIETFQQFKDEVGFISLKDYDLLLVDLNLDDDKNEDGNKIIEEIRGNDIYIYIYIYIYIRKLFFIHQIIHIYLNYYNRIGLKEFLHLIENKLIQKPKKLLM